MTFVLNNDIVDIQQMNTFTDDTANFLSTKLDLLRESPGGLKLNPQLTSFLTTLCFHHIRIWQNYAKLLFTKIMLNRSYLHVICCLNSACFLALVSDMFSLLTLHFYCFYIYSLRLYQVWIYGLGELLNLFRGLKYNPLKKRVDSVFEEFDTQRFILGAMIFSIFLFLFPTVLIFYLIFTMARLVCHFIQELLVLHSYLTDSIARRLLSEDECPETKSTFQQNENLSLLNKIIYGHNF